MEKLVKKIITCKFEELNDINFPKNEQFGLNVILNGLNFEFLLNIKENSDKLLIFGSGARVNQSEVDKKRPWFNRWSWKFNESQLYYNDPTTYCYPELTTGWGIGTKKRWFLKEISAIIEKISKKIGISHENMIFLGSSAGGFTSIILSTLLKDTIGIAEIPQFNLQDYNGSFHWNLLKKYCFENMSTEEIYDKYGFRVDVITLFKKMNYIPKLYLILDCSVERDLKYNYIPFFKRLNELPYSDIQNNIKIRIDGKNKGHCGQDYPSTLDTLKKIFSIEHNTAPYLDYIITPEGFKITNKTDISITFNDGINSIIITKQDSEDIKTAMNQFKQKYSSAKIFANETVINGKSYNVISMQNNTNYHYNIFVKIKNEVYIIRAFSYEKTVQRGISQILNSVK